LKEILEERREGDKRVEVAEWRLKEKEEEAERKAIEWRKEKDRINRMWEERL
jgi:hypothetical protein